jgi:hypothetical protein
VNSNQISGNPQNARAGQRPPGNITGRRALTALEERQWPQHSIGYRRDRLGPDHQPRDPGQDSRPDRRRSCRLRQALRLFLQSHDELDVLGEVSNGRYVIRRGIIGLEPMPRRIAS